jgi:long-subunit fatty acid transport protein
MNASRRRQARALALALVVVAELSTLVRRSSASPSARAGFGSRSQALAGAEVADARGASGVFENPAALVQTPDTELALGTSFTSYDFTVDGTTSDLPAVPTFDFGLVVPGSVLTIPIAFGLALSLPDGRFSKLHNADPTVPYYPLDDSGPRLFDLGMALALRPTSWLAVGGGVGFLAAAQGGFRVTGNAVAADGTGSEYSSELRHSVDADLISVRYPIFGATITPSKDVVVGASFRGAATIEQDVAGELDGTATIGAVEIPVRYRFETRASLAFSPPIVALGATVRPLPAFRLSGQLDWEGWSDYPSPFAAPKTSLDIDPPPGVVLEPPEQSPLPEPVAFDDRVVARVGAEWGFQLSRAIEVLPRVGAAYFPAVVPERQDQTLLVDFDRLHVALGAGGVFRRPFAPFAEIRLDVHASYVAGLARTQLVASGAAQGEHPVAGRQFSAGATLGLAFDALGRSPADELY